MPCLSSDGMGDAYREDPQARQKIATLEAVLCAVVGAIGVDRIIAKANWKDAGVDANTLRTWWAEHQKRDEARRRDNMRLPNPLTR